MLLSARKFILWTGNRLRILQNDTKSKLPNIVDQNACFYHHRIWIRKPSAALNYNLSILFLRNNINFKNRKILLNHTSLVIKECHRTIQTSARRYNPIVSAIVRQAIKVATMFTARALRKWYRNLPEEKRKLVLIWLRKHRRKFMLLFTMMALSTVYYYQSHIQQTPITKRRRFIAFTPEQFKLLNEIGLEMVLKEFAKQLLPNNDSNTRRVAKVANQLINRNQDLKEIKDYEWTVSVIDDPNIMNAFVLPSGNIFVYTGLLRFCENDNQLGIVLSHEISHAILAHSFEKVSHVHIVDLLFICLLGFVWMFFPTDIIAAIGSTISRFMMKIAMETPYSKMLETEADEVGLKLAAKACFDVREASAFWLKMAYMEKLIMTEMFGTPEAPVNLDFLSTHPSSQERSENLEKWIESAIVCRSQSGCSPLPRADPRERVKNQHQNLVIEKVKKEMTGVFKIKEFREL